MSKRARRAGLGLASLATLAIATFLGLACKKSDPTKPVDLADEACCSRANEKMTRFAGCRVGGRCRSAEPIWLRGSIKCTPVEARCMNGRCCEYIPLYGSPDAVLNWDDGEGDKAATPADPPAEAPPAEAPPAEAAAPEPAAAEPSE